MGVAVGEILFLDTSVFLHAPHGLWNSRFITTVYPY